MTLRDDGPAKGGIANSGEKCGGIGHSSYTGLLFVFGSLWFFFLSGAMSVIPQLLSLPTVTFPLFEGDFKHARPK